MKTYGGVLLTVYALVAVEITDAVPIALVVLLSRTQVTKCAQGTSILYIMCCDDGVGARRLYKSKTV
jgi:hypothetical protein